MGLPNLFSKPKKQNTNLYISILLTDVSVNSVLWRVADQQVQLLNQSSTRYYQTQDEQVTVCDESLQDLGKESEETDQVLFALEPEWATQTEVKIPYDQRLEELCKSLSLEAAGFILVTEAIHNHLVHKNRYLSALVLYLGSTSLTLNVIIQGQVQKTLSVGRSENILLDVQEVLARLNGDLTDSGQKLPLNIYLASASVEPTQMALYQQQLLAIDWVAEHGLIQQPVIEFIRPDQIMDAVVKQGGTALAQDQGLTTVEPDASFATNDEELLENLIDQDDQAETETAVDSSNLPPSANITSPPIVTSFGVPIGQDQFEQAKKNKKTSDVSFNQTKDILPRKNQKKLLSKKKKIILIAIAGAILGLVVSAVVSFFLLKASYRVTVVLQPEVMKLNKESTILLSSDITQSDPEQSLLKAEKISKEVTGDETILTTGVKQVGEKAEGEIRILNKTDSDKTFVKGTVVSAGEIEFVLDEEVNIPASKVEVSTTGDSEKREYGQKNVKVIAVEIGTEGNLSKDTDFKIESFSDETYSAKAVDNFTGGSSREIRVVAEADIQELMVTLRQRLLKQARDELLESNKIDVHVIPTEDFEIISQEYDGEIGDEADDVSLSLKVKVDGLTYTNQDLIDLAKLVLVDDVPDDYEFVEEGLKVDSQLAEETKQEAQFQILALLEGKAQAKIDQENVKNNLAGLSLDEASSKIKNENAIEKLEFSYSPGLAASLFSTLPSSIERIELAVKR